MELRRLRILAAIAERQSIGRAARALGIAQPAVSRQLRALEASVLAALLTRSAKGVSLAPAGRALLERAGGLDDLLARAVHDARLTAEGRLGRLRIGLGRIAVDAPRVGQALEAVRQKEPGIELVVAFLGSPEHTRALLQGETDLVIGTEESPPHRRLSRRVLDSDLICAALVAATHPIARRGVLDPDHLSGLPLFMAGRHLGWIFPAVRERLRKLGFGDPVEVDALETAFAYVAAGAGWMPVSRSFESHPPDGTVAVPLRGLDVAVPLLLRWRRGDDSPLLARASRILVRAFQSASPGTAAVMPVDAASVGGPRKPAGDRESASSPAAVIDRIECRHLRALVAIAGDGSVADAARRLGVTQSAVSRQVISLERIVGTALFRRVRAGMVPTPAGEVMRVGAGEVLRLVDAAARGARLAAQGVERRCIVGVLPSPIANDALINLLRRAPRELPAITIEVRELTSPRLAEALRCGQVDVALMMLLDTQAPDSDLRPRFVATDAYDTVLVSARGPLARRTTLAAADLRDLPLCFLSRAESPRYHDSMLARLRKAGIEPRIGATCEGPRAIWRHVADGSGWALGLRSMRAKPPAGVVGLPLDGFSIPASLHVVSRADESDPHVRALASAI